LADCHVGRSRGLKTFHATDPDTDMGGLNHRHIIGTVTDSQEKSLLVTLDKLNDQSFLKGRDTTKKALE